MLCILRGKHYQSTPISTKLPIPNVTEAAIPPANNILTPPQIMLFREFIAMAPPTNSKATPLISAEYAVNGPKTTFGTKTPSTNGDMGIAAPKKNAMNELIADPQGEPNSEGSNPNFSRARVSKATIGSDSNLDDMFFASSSEINSLV